MSSAVAVGFLDLAGYTALTAVHGDESGADIAERFASVIRVALRDGDELVKTVGDGALVLSTSAVGLAALSQRVCESLDSEQAFPVMRIGLHAGPLVRRSGDVFGTSVNTAARVAALAAGGQTLATDEFVQRLEGAYRVRPLRPVQLKGIEQAVALHELELCPAPHERLIDPVCGMALLPTAVVGPLRQPPTTVVFCSERCMARYLCRPR